MTDAWGRDDAMRFFTGLHQPSDVHRFDAAFVSVNRLRSRKAPMRAQDWIMDSGAFTEISTHGHYRHSVAEYASEIRRWAAYRRLLADIIGPVRLEQRDGEVWAELETKEPAAVACAGSLLGSVAGARNRTRIRIA